MKEYLDKYKINGNFKFSRDQSLEKQCNASKNYGGIYLIFALSEDKIGSLIYIGSSGWVNQKGEFLLRKKGMYDRIVNGKQFDTKRKYSWAIKMKEDKINEIQVDWYVTYDENIKHIPAYSEAVLIQKYFDENKLLPLWNLEF